MYDIHLTTHNITQVEEALTKIIHKIPVSVINTSLTNTLTCPLVILLKSTSKSSSNTLNVCCVHHSFHYVPITSSSARLQDKSNLKVICSLASIIEWNTHESRRLVFPYQYITLPFVTEIG